MFYYNSGLSFLCVFALFLLYIVPRAFPLLTHLAHQSDGRILEIRLPARHSQPLWMLVCKRVSRHYVVPAPIIYTLKMSSSIGGAQLSTL